MKKISKLIIIMFVLIIIITGCGTNDTVKEDGPDNTSINEKNQQVQEVTKLTDIEVMKMYTNPEDYVGRVVDLTGRVFSEPEYDSDGVYFQMFADLENSEKNTIIAFNDSNFLLGSDDYVRISGEVVDVFEGTNAFGGTIIAPAIVAYELEVISYMDAVSPTVKEVIPTNSTETQYGYSVSVDKVEFADNETRVYLTVENAGSSKFNLYSFYAKIIQDGKQYEEETNYSADYPEVQTDLMVGVTTNGIFTFPKIEISDFQLVMEASSENWDEDLSPYIFDVSVSQ
jgi:hypothetical protein